VVLLLLALIDTSCQCAMVIPSITKSLGEIITDEISTPASTTNKPKIGLPQPLADGTNPPYFMGVDGSSHRSSMNGGPSSNEFDSYFRFLKEENLRKKKEREDCYDRFESLRKSGVFRGKAPALTFMYDPCRHLRQELPGEKDKKTEKYRDCIEAFRKSGMEARGSLDVSTLSRYVNPCRHLLRSNGMAQSKAQHRAVNLVEPDLDEEEPQLQQRFLWTMLGALYGLSKIPEIPKLHVGIPVLQTGITTERPLEE